MFSLLKMFLSASPKITPARTLYIACVNQARNVFFYRTCGVPDSLDGRFEMIVLHVGLVLQRLKREGAAHDDLMRDISEIFFDDMDRGLREVGISDLKVGKKIKAMATAFYGRLQAYESAVDRSALEEALRRNAFGTVQTPSPEGVFQLAHYMQNAQAQLAASPANLVLSASVPWPKLT
jgi:cytochrome b pre-mRNA-processing protein 3